MKYKTKPAERLAVRAAGVVLRVEPTRAATAATVTVGIPLKVNPWVLIALQSEGPLFAEGRTIDHFDRTTVAYAAFLGAKEKLEGNAAVAIKNKVTATCCGAQGGEFIISVTTDRSLSSARRCAGVVLASMRFKPLYQRYAALCRTAGVKPAREAFDAAAADASRAFTSGVTIVVTGRVFTTKEQIDKSAAALAKKIAESAGDPGKARVLQSTDVKTRAETFDSIPAPGIDGVVLLNYLEAGLRGVPLHLHSGRVWYPKGKDRSIRALAAGDKIARYAKILAKLGKEMLGAIVYIAARGCSAATESLSVSGSVDVAAVISRLLK